MTYLHAIILGIIEGVTEFLPISSTGHLVLAGHILHLPSSEFLKSFDIAIQLGAIFAVLTVYGRDLLTRWELVKRIIVAFIPTAVIGLVLYRQVKHLLDNPSVVVWSLGIGGLALIIFEKKYHEPTSAHGDLATMPYGTAVLIGLAQSIAMIPGISRAAATICGGLALGVSRRAIVEFSFLLALPTMTAATGLDLLKTGSSFTSHEWGLLAVGLITSWIVAFASIKWLLGFIRTHNFAVFGKYRIIIAIAAFFLLLR
jgi:undecaprenyl-diphosphatase